MGEGSVSCSLALPSIPLSSLLAYFMQHGRLHSTVAGEGDSSPALCAPRAAARRCAALRPTPCGKAVVSGGAAAACMLALSGRSLLLRAEFHTGAGDQWPQQHCRKGMKKKILYRKTNRVTLIGYSSLRYSEWIHFIHYFILYLQLLLLIEQAIIESWW